MRNAPSWLRNLRDELEGLALHDDRVQRTAEQTRKLLEGSQPEFGIVFGSGLNGLAGMIAGGNSMSYRALGIPQTTTGGHENKLLTGEIRGVPVIGFQGRRHFYEVAGRKDAVPQVVYAVDVLAALGVPNVLFTNAAGGVNLSYKTADLMAITSHLNLTGASIDGEFREQGIRAGLPSFWPLCEAYDPGLRETLMRGTNGTLHEGVYSAIRGPMYESEAEVLMLRKNGVDASGMSTVLEASRARQHGMKVLGVTCITNLMDEFGRNKTDHKEVAAVMSHPDTQARFVSAFEGFFREYRRERDGI